MMMRLTTASLAGLGALAALMLTVTVAPAQTDGVRNTNCVGGGWWFSFSCVTVRRKGVVNPHVIHIPGPISEQQNVEFQQRDKLWQARCRPVVKQDDYGVPRYVYAAPGCEFGRVD